VVLTTPPCKTFLVTKHHIEDWRRPSFFQNCRATEEEVDQGGNTRILKIVSLVGLWGWEVDESGSGSCPAAGLCSDNVEPSGSAATVLLS